MPTTPTRNNYHEIDPVLASLPLAAGGGATDEFDALADLFLSDDDSTRGFEDSASASKRPMETRRAAIELLVQGHLPVRAAPWASQYARLRSSAMQSPVALIRLVGGNLSVEMFGVESAECGAAVDAADAVREAMRCAALLIVQLDEVHQAAIAADPRVAGVTVLAGVNEAAVVATYRTLKGLAGVLAPAVDGEEPPTDLQVAFVTTEDGAARDALERLRRAASVFLDRPLALAGTVGKIAPTGAVPLFRGECEMGPGRLLDLLTGDAGAKADRTRGVVEGAHARDEVAAATRVNPVVDPHTAHREFVSLARFVEGLRSLGVRWPDDSAVELAVDAAGRLHLLREDVDGRGVERLVGAAAWAVKHAALLSAAGCGVDFQQPAMLRLFTGVPKSVKHLLDADLRVHVLARVGAEWYCAELN